MKETLMKQATAAFGLAAVSMRGEFMTYRLWKNFATAFLLATASMQLSSTASAATITQLYSPFAGCLNNFELNKTDCATFDASSTIVTAFLWTDSVTPSGSFGLVEAKEDVPLRATFGASNVVGMYFGNDDFNLIVDVKLSVFDSSNVLLGSVFVSANSNDWADQFIGLSSDTFFTSAEISYARPNAGILSVYIDDFRVGSADVPEPSSIALIAMALLSLFGFGVMRKRAEA